MPVLNARQIKCLRLLWEEKQFRSAGYLADKLQVSDKTVLHDIKVIQEYLTPFHVELIRKTGKGIYLPEKARGNQELLNSLMDDSDALDDNFFMSTEHRRKEIIRRMLLGDGSGLSIQKLSDEFYVSRAGIVNDFRAVERWGEQYGLTLNSDHGRRMFEGPEKGVRHAIAAWIRESNPAKNTESTLGVYNNSGEDGAFSHMNIFDDDDIAMSDTMMEYLESVCGNTISEPYYSYLRDHILICISRVKRGHFISEDDNTVMEVYRPQWDYACGLLEIMREKWEIPDREIYYLYKYIASSDIGNNKKEIAQETEDGFDLAKTVSEELTACVLKALRITVNDDSALMQGLMQHVRPMLNRLEYDIKIQSSILADAQENYGELLGLCDAALWCIGRKYSLKEVSINEVSYIAMYYLAMLEEKRREKRILVVSNSGFGTTQLFVTRLKKYFPLYEVVDVMSVVQLEKRTDFHDIDFVISAVPLDGIPVPCITVSPVMSDTDIRNILDTISANWMEDQLSLDYLKRQYEDGRLELHTLSQGDIRMRKSYSPYLEKEFAWGHCLQVVAGFHTESSTAIYRRELESDVWRLVTHACTYDELLKQLAEAYQMLCSSKGRRLTERCYCTEDLKNVFD